MYWSPVRSETGFVILRKFWSRYDLQNFRKWNFLGDDQGELSKGTLHIFNTVFNPNTAVIVVDFDWNFRLTKKYWLPLIH